MIPYTRSSGGIQNLEFKHDLTAIQFIAAEDINSGSIKKVTIKGVYSTASTKIGSNVWYGHSNIDDFNIEFNSDLPSVGNASNSNIVAGDNTFLMLPQILPPTAEIEIEFIDITNTSRTLKASIANSEWKPGTVIKYYISTESILYTPIFTLPEDTYTLPFSAMLQNKEIAFASYTEVSKAGEPTTYLIEPYEMSFINEAGNSLNEGIPYLNANVLMQNASDLGNTVYTKPSDSNILSIDVMAKYGNYTEELNEYDLSLRREEPVTLKNLAGESGSETTANCYIVSVPGTYKLPLIYGNALKNGLDNDNTSVIF